MRLGSIDLPRWAALLLCFGALLPELLLPGVGALFLFAATAIALAISADARAATWRWTPNGRKGRELLVGLAAGVAIVAISEGVVEPLVEAWTGYTPDLSSFAKLRGNIANTVAMLAIGWVVGGLFEEVSHRGMVIGWGSRLLGDRAAVPLMLMVSVVFGATHAYQGIGGAISTGIVSLLLGMLYLWRGRVLLAPVIAHGTIDTIGILALYMGYGL